MAGNETQCSSCVLRYAAGLLNSTYGRIKLQPSGFSSLLSSCSAKATLYPYSSISTTTVVAPTASATACSGSTYTVASGDTCQSIARAKSVATDRLITQNDLDYNCTTLTAGMELCLGATCALQTIVMNQTCDAIAAGKQFTTIQLISWNPLVALHPIAQFYT